MSTNWKPEHICGWWTPSGFIKPHDCGACEDERLANVSVGQEAKEQGDE